MAIRITRVTITSVRKPVSANLNRDLQCFGQSLGLFGERDKDKSCFRLFIELIKAARKKELLTSDEFAERLNLSRGTVIHHMHKLMDSGIVVSDGNRYILRVDNLEALVQEIKRDMDNVFRDLYEMASEIDKDLGIK